MFNKSIDFGDDVVLNVAHIVSAKRARMKTIG